MGYPMRPCRGDVGLIMRTDEQKKKHADYMREYYKTYKNSPVLKAYKQSDVVKEKARIAANKYYEEHKEERLEYARNRRKNFPLTKEQKAKKEEYRKGWRKTESGIASEINYRKSDGGVAVAKRSCHNYSKSEKGRLSRATRHNRRRSAKMMVENNFTLEMWKQTLEEYNYLCAYCGSKENIQQEHIVPISKGGNHIKDNIVPACYSCNSSKRDKTLLVWMYSRAQL